MLFELRRPSLKLGGPGSHITIMVSSRGPTWIGYDALLPLPDQEPGSLSGKRGLFLSLRAVSRRSETSRYKRKPCMRAASMQFSVEGKVITLNDIPRTTADGASDRNVRRKCCQRPLEEVFFHRTMEYSEKPLGSGSRCPSARARSAWPGIRKDVHRTRQGLVCSSIWELFQFHNSSGQLGLSPILRKVPSHASANQDVPRHVESTAIARRTGNAGRRAKRRFSM